MGGPGAGHRPAVRQPDPAAGDYGGPAGGLGLDAAGGGGQGAPGPHRPEAHGGRPWGGPDGGDAGPERVLHHPAQGKSGRAGAAHQPGADFYPVQPVRRRQLAGAAQRVLPGGGRHPGPQRTPAHPRRRGILAGVGPGRGEVRHLQPAPARRVGGAARPPGPPGTPGGAGSPGPPGRTRPQGREGRTG